MGYDAEAAKVEASRVRLYREAEPLSGRALEALAIAARQNGDVESARALEEMAVEALFS
jgi:hypothetical protein